MAQRSAKAQPQSSSAGGRTWRFSRPNTRQLVLGGAALLAGGIAALVVLLLSPSRPGQISPATSSPPSVPAANPSSQAGSSQSAAAQSPEWQAAQGLAALLTQSVADRSSVVQAVNDVNNCGGNLSQDAQTFTSAANSRNTLLSQLANLSDSSALSQQMLGSLKAGWQASVQADQDFAQWAQDENANGCTPNDHSDPGYAAANGPDAQATTEKQAFASLWDPIAARYGLTSYQWYQL